MDELKTSQTAPLPRQPDRPPGLRRFGSGARVAAGLAVIAVLAGACLLGVSLTSGSGPQASGAALAANTSGGAAASGDGHGAVASAKSGGFPRGPAWLGPGARRARARLRACVASARRLRASGHRAAARARLRACIRRYVRLRVGLATLRLHRLRMLIRRTLHGQITIETNSGPTTLAFERGAVQSASGSSLVVMAADGTTWTWALSSATRVIKAWHRVGANTLATGEQVVVVGEVSGGSDQARRVVILG